jgi:hypothetical protein
MIAFHVFPALEGADFRYQGFHPGNFDVPSTVDVAIVQRPAPVTSPPPHLTPPVAIDLYDSVLRSIDRPASCADFAMCLRQLLAAHICDVDLFVMPHGTVRHHVEEMPTPVGDFRRQRPARTFCSRR